MQQQKKNRAQATSLQPAPNDSLPASQITHIRNQQFVTDMRRR